ncbi:amidohydrolase family protein, partial [Xanthomonas citri pv. citri]|nr:amidohydrolase family protein [Xanthomonas citri pv. citri]
MSAPSPAPLLLRSARLTTGETADVLVAEGRIAALGPDAAAHAAGLEPTPEEVDCAGLVLLPGLVDLHTHLRQPGKEDAETVETGTRAAAMGGFTSVHAMGNSTPTADTAGVVEQVW